MKRLMHSLWLTAAAALLLLAPATAAHAQQTKPIAVISVAPIDKLFGDVDYLTKTAGQADAGRLATLIAGPYIDGVDRTKPSGAYVMLDGDKPVSVAFIPTKDLTKILATLKDSVGEPKDVGNGVQQLGDAPIFLKQEGSYVFVAQDAAHLANLPKDPVALLAGLEKTYSIAARLDVKSIPPAQKERIIAEMKQGFEAAPIEADDPAQRELAEKTGRNVLNQMIRLVEESNDITLGWAVDPTAKSTYIDFVFTAIDGTKLAKTMANLKDAKTNFAGFLLPDAAFTALSANTVTDQEEIGQTLALLDGARAQMLKELEKEELDDDELAAAQELINSLMDVLSATVKEGKFDGGAVAVAESESLTFVAGGHVVDAPKFEAAVKKAVKFAQTKKPEEFEDVVVAFDSGKHGGIRFHTFTFPVKEEQPQKVFGEEMAVILGVGDKAAYIAAGSDAEATLKQVIDKSAAEAGKAVLPGQMTLAIGPIIKFVDSVEPNPITSLLVTAAAKVKGNDRIMINVKAIPNGEQVRFEIEEGVLQLIGEGAKAAQGGGGGDF